MNLLSTIDELNISMRTLRRSNKGLMLHRSSLMKLTRCDVKLSRHFVKAVSLYRDGDVLFGFLGWQQFFFVVFPSLMRDFRPNTTMC